ncbi:MAG TPA: zinc ribbon domain-containing protein [Nitrosomonas sp.]|nr:hypothetical protein [Nitrosomonas sp.]HNP25573.1 zinc ribbon domain-containing protein [Nitrosomonas sp.]
MEKEITIFKDVDMLCPKCGTENTEQAETCVNCNERLVSEDAQAVQAADMEMHQQASHESMESDHAQSQRSPRITHVDIQSDQAQDKPVVSSGLNIGIIIATIIFPIVGIAMGFTYLRKEHPDAKQAGKTWLILGVVVFLINILMISLD